MKTKILSVTIVALFLGAFPVVSDAQQQGPGRSASKPVVDTSKIPIYQRPQKWKEDSSNVRTIEGVVVVAYGAQKRSAVTGAIAQISDSQMVRRPVTNLAEALTGAAPGIQSTLSSGQPGGSPNIRVRGFGSISAGSSPLIVVDGIVYDGDLASINAADVASMSTLMDAASAALYGSRGSNGVILITTKKGSARNKKPAVQFKTSQGFSERMLPEYARVNAYEYYPLMWEFYRNGLVSSQGGMLADKYATEDIKSMLGYNPFNVPDDKIVDGEGKLNPNAKLLYPDDLDWEKASTRKGYRQEYTVSFNGGNETADYYASMGYIGENGYTPTSDFKRWNGRVNANARISSKVKAGLNVYGSSTNTNQTPTSSNAYVNPFMFARSMGPIYPVYAHDATGAYILDDNGKPKYDDGVHTGSLRPFALGRNALAEGLLNVNYLTGISLGARTNIDVALHKNLKFTSNIGLDQETTESYQYMNPIIGDGAPSGALTRGSDVVRSYTFNQLLNYTKRFDGHNIEALIGHENYDRKSSGTSASVRGQIAAGNNLELGNYSTSSEMPNSYSIAKRVESYLSRISYDFNETYFATASVRRDGNSFFATDKRWANFWSVGGAWRISKEKFFQEYVNLPYLNELKLKASYGKVGNDAVGSYAYQGGYMSNNNAQEPGYIYAVIPNKDLTWESLNNLNLGIEFSLFKDRISGYVQYFDKQSTGLVFAVPQPLSGGGTPSGVYSIWQNIGSMYNRGWEASVTGTVLQTKKANWQMVLNASTLENKVTKMPETNKEIVSGTKKLSVGHSVYDFWLISYKGVDPANGDALFVLDPKNTYDDGAPYDYPDKTIMGERYTTTVARAKYDYHGSAIPDLYGSLRNDVRYKNFSLNVLFTYQIGGLAYDGLYATLMSPTFGQAVSADIAGRWKQTGDQTDIPRMDYGRSGDFDGSSSRWLISATSLTVNNINLGYSFEPSVLKQLKLAGLQTYLSVENVYQFSARKGMNVLQSFNGTTTNGFVPRRVYSLGVVANL
ncbi:SusC/RagA family TonB-linked outer membrane protein [Chitinophagaceae bacterium LB-8]|uniref:SusC/RagA family TonB-linked outer membrane protein n=1 Tax=Paraflavisolibacter caeni TaxID=2982496 RepID=A0A9X2XSH8_9BACT|nr:SusC/RagA family TonB-linked outer membrane protein [Paraflavisolibacter caeni]MCU7547890.1 SusC/RagA family TonB-linked outer membrane protein [Paraflavisolibacter caeni]